MANLEIRIYLSVSFEEVHAVINNIVCLQVAVVNVVLNVALGVVEDVVEVAVRNAVIDVVSPVRNAVPYVVYLRSGAIFVAPADAVVAERSVNAANDCCEIIALCKVQNANIHFELQLFILPEYLMLLTCKKFQRGMQLISAKWNVNQWCKR